MYSEHVTDTQAIIKHLLMQTNKATQRRPQGREGKDLAN